MSGKWRSGLQDVPVSHSIVLPPHPHFLDSLGGNHRLETALADLIDNSIDAGATEISIRFFIEDDQVRSLQVIDNGHGIGPSEIDSAMTFGNVRDYGPTDLGHFGLGLKAASFSQADSLSVISRADGSEATGRRWLTVKATGGYECDVIVQEFCQAEMGRYFGEATSGTIVRWDRIRTFPDTDDVEVLQSFLNDTVNRLQQHLGLVFHRFLSDDAIRITIDVEEAISASVGAPFVVRPLDPFGYPRSGAAGYPKELSADLGADGLRMTCHIWPGRSQLPQYRLPLQSVEQYQGFYFYRRRRLLQAGGWNSLEVVRRDLQFARVAVELDEPLLGAGIVRMNPEKSRVEPSHEFSTAVNKARAEDGTTFRQYLATAAEHFKQSNQRRRVRSAVVPLGRGLPPRLRQVVQRELPVLAGVDPVDIKWRRFDSDEVFEIDRDGNTIWLNQAYRKTILGDRRAGFNDAPLFKLLFFLLSENLFHGAWFGPKDKDNIALWQELLKAAVAEELG